MELTAAQIQFIEDNLQSKTIIRIARELSKELGLGREDRISRKDIITYFKDNFDRNLVHEKFGPTEG